MCRIAGMLYKHLDIVQMQLMVKNMCTLLQHGGPDDEGIVTFTENNLVLGNRRLALIDLTNNGHQPMHYENRYTITYNGELYNFATLKNELWQLGYHFKTGTDTEIILAAFAQWHTDSFSKLNGMFAFAMWDNKEKKLYLVRDAVGIKPLYFSTHNNGIAFASEVRAFSPIPFLRQKNSSTAIYQLAYGYIPEPLTTLAHVTQLPKGCYITYDTNTQNFSLQSFLYFSFSNQINNYETATQSINKSLSNAVQRQLLADARVGVFLSGGIDSTIIASLAKQQNPNIETISIYFDDENYSEKKYQDIVAKQINSKHEAYLIQETEFQNLFPSFLSALDMPSCDGLNTWFISKYASSLGLKAVLSGIGADEMFGGYPSFKRIDKALTAQKLPKLALQLSDNTALKNYRRASYLKIDGIRGIYLFLRGHFTPNQIAKHIGAYDTEVFKVLEAAPNSPNLLSVTTKNKASWMEFNLYMKDQLLRDADVMSMAHGLEIRVPFLDNEIIDTAFSINDNIKFDNNVPKKILIESFNALLPKKIWDRPKMGFSFPFANWLKNNEMVQSLSFNTNKNVQISYQQFMEGKLHWSRIMSLLILNNKNY